MSVRVFTCDDGSGTMTIRTVNHEAEFTPNTAGSWQIVEGTGSYASLRGKGAVTGVPVSGDVQRPETLTFRARWQGIVDFDDVAPTVAVSRVGATKLRRPTGAYLIRVAFTAHDDVEENVVSYRVTAFRSGVFQLAVKRGDTTSGAVAVALRILVTEPVRKIRLTIEASDPLGNERKGCALGEAGALIR